MFFSEFLDSDAQALSRHAGFDARLCYGDITLGFRFFPLGLPESSLILPEAYREAGEKVTSSPLTPVSVTKNEIEVSPTENFRQHEVLQGKGTERPDGIYNKDDTRVNTPFFEHKWTTVHLKHGEEIGHFTRWLSSCFNIKYLENISMFSEMGT